MGLLEKSHRDLAKQIMKRRLVSVMWVVSRTWKEQELLPKPKVPAVVVLLASCPICFSLSEVLLLLPVFREQPKSNFIYVSFFFSVPVCSCSCRRLDSTRLDSTRLGLRLRLRLRLDFYMYVDG